MSIKRGKIVGNTGCPQCIENGRDSTRNHLMIFEDGAGYCNRCKYSEKPDPENTMSSRLLNRKSKRSSESSESFEDILSSKVHSLKSRGIPKAVLKEYNCRTILDESTGEVKKVYFGYCRNGKVVTFKGRRIDIKEFLPTVGDKFKDIDLFGSHLWEGPKNCVILHEGELCCLSGYYILDKYNRQRGLDFTPHVGSIANGATGAAKEIVKSWSYLQKYKKVILCFDNDEEGQKAIRAVAKAIPSKDLHKLHIMKLPDKYKDANDVLMAKKLKTYINAFFAASQYRPSQVVKGTDISLKSLRRPLQKGLDTPWPGIDAKLKGSRSGELTIITGGSGVGKTTFTRALHYQHLHVHQQRVFGIYLEDGRPSEDHPMKAAQSLIALHNNIALPRLRLKPKLLSEAKWKASYDELIGNDRSWFIDHFGGMSIDELMEQLMFASTTLQADVVILDHISMLFSGQKSSETGNERKDIDLLMTELAKFCSKTGVSIYAISHISKGAQRQDKDGKRYIEVQSLDDLRGSSAIGQLSWNVIALNKAEGNFIEPLILKNREWGNLGPCPLLEYSPKTGWLTEIEEEDSYED